MERKKKAALYTRVSTVYQVDKDSLPQQKGDLVKYINVAFGIQDYVIFEDAGFSGKNTDRPAYQDMMSRIRAGEFTHLFVNKIDRISRNLLDFAAMYDELKKLGVVFVSRNEQFDTSSAMGEAMLKIILVFAELERHMTSERVTAVMIDRAKKGKWNGANVPFGYHWSEEKRFPEIDEAEARIVRMIFRKYLDGVSTLKLCGYLNSHHIMTKRGGAWASTTVNQILHNPFYKGTLRYNYRNAARGNVKKESEWIVLDHNHPALVSSEDWDRVQQLLTEHNHNKHQRAGKRIHIFADLMYCLCGMREYSKMDKYRKRDNYTPSYYECGNHRDRIGLDTRCDNNRSISDKVVGTFVLSYMQNMLAVQQNIRDYLDRGTMEHRLLRGTAFAEISQIDVESMDAIYESFMQQSNIDYHPKQEISDEDTDMVLREHLLKEKATHERALERLNKAYLYSDIGIPEESFLAERKKIMDELAKVEASLKEHQQEVRSQQQDYDFLDRASDYLIKAKLLAEDDIDWAAIAPHIDDKALRQFFLTTIRRIVTYKGVILSIEFQNGVKHRFLYKN